EALPEGNSLVTGEWWPANYTGPPLVSLDEELATAAGISVGDIITNALLGVERSARVSSIRRNDWESLGFNNVFVFSPTAVADAPHNLAATIQLPEGTAPPPGLLRRMVREFPSSSVVEVGPLLTEARAILDQVALAILAAASVAVLA